MKLFSSPLGDIYLGNVQNGLSELVSSFHASKVVMVADENTSAHCIPLLQSAVDTSNLIVISAGEINKNLSSCEQIWSSLISHGADRSSLIINVGGGMICDLGGFAASCFQRGIRFGHIPTSVLAMADAAIGGKTGIDFEGFKNYLGRFEPPVFTWVDPVFIKTLPEKEVYEGFAEVIKHAIVGSRALWDIVYKLENLQDLDWNQVLEENISIKKAIVEADPFEKGLRKVLNFGHTIGHALESHFLQTKRPISHGQAVSLGMLAESKIAVEKGIIKDEEFQLITELIHRLLRPVEVTLPSLTDLTGWIEGDKKKVGGRVGYSLPNTIGSCHWDIQVEEHIVALSFDWLSTQVRAPAHRLIVE